jgi:hypothetical protein
LLRQHGVTDDECNDRSALNEERDRTSGVS